MPESTGPAGRGPGGGLETGQGTSLGTGQAAVTAPSPAPVTTASWCKIIGDWAWDEPPGGLSRAAAVGAASWTARTWLGLPGLTDGAPADLVIYDEDPAAHPDILHHPRLIILRGQILA
jgi:hypothetical protein